jgi:hypothetical protein
VWQPSLDAKDYALGLEDHKSELPESRRVRVTAAVRQIVQSAWAMETTSDLGDKQKLSVAHARFAAAVRELESAYASKP